MRLDELFGPSTANLPWVNSPEFKAWFGNSKVVDERGNPRVVFHGTFEDFKVFKLHSEKRRSHNFNRLGFWFDVNPHTPNFFAGHYPRGNAPENAKAGNVVMAFLSIQKPLIFSSTPIEIEDRKILNHYLRINDKGGFNNHYREMAEYGREDPFDRMIKFISQSYRGEILEKWPQEKSAFRNIPVDEYLKNMVLIREPIIEKFKQDCIAEGYDGIYLPETLADGTTRPGNIETDWWIAFHPNQIKAALGNRGTFSKDSEDITERAKVKLVTSGENIGAWVHDGFPWQGKPEKTVILPINKIDVNEPDSKFDDPENAANLKSIQKALKKGKTLPPILVRRVGMRFQVLDGHHRFKAYRSLGMKKIPARIVHARNIEEAALPQANSVDREKAMLYADELGYLRGGEYKALPVEAIPTKDLVATQTYLNDEKVRNYSKSDNDPIFAVHYKGKYYVFDGHHRAEAALASGKPTVQAHVLTYGPKPYHFVGSCVNSFDDDGACIISELPWATVSDFAVAEENATPISVIDFLKNASVPENVTPYNFEYMMADDVLIAYDPKKDVHYFFVKSSFGHINENRMFVIGDASIYDPLLQKNKLRKAGKDFKPGYPGGDVYLRKDDAVKAALQASRTGKGRYAVYLLNEPYTKDNVWFDSETNSHRLLHGMQVSKKLTENDEKPVDEIKALEADLESRYPVELDMYRAYHGGNLVLSRIVAKTKNQGTGTAVMQEIVNFADKHDLTITLSPDSSLGGNKARLQSFYKRFGFKSNLGRKRDYRYSESMIRRPNRG